jgi:hypothetical protein
MEDDLHFIKIEGDLNFFPNGRQPQFFSKMEDDLNFSNMEDDLKNFKNERQPQYFQKWKTT